MSVENNQNIGGGIVGVSDDTRHDRAHKYWLSLLSNRAMPTIADLTAERLGEFKTQSFLIAIAGQDKSPVVSFVGKEIFTGLDCPPLKPGASLDNVADDSLLSKLTDEFSEIQNSCEPIQFDVGVFNSAKDFPSKGVLMPFGAAESVQFIWGVLSDRKVEAPAEVSFDAPADDLSFDGGSDGSSQFDTVLSEDNSFEADEVFNSDAVESEVIVEEDSFFENERLSGFDVYQDKYEGEAYHITDVATIERSDLGTGKVSSEVYLGFDDRADTCEGEAYDISEVVTCEGAVVFYDDDQSKFDQSDISDTNDGFAGSIAEADEESGFDGFAGVSDGDLNPTAKPNEVPPEPEPESGPDPEIEPELQAEEHQAEDSFDEGTQESPEKKFEEDQEEELEEELENEVPFFNILADGRTAADGVVHVNQRSRLSLYSVLAKAYALYEESQDDRDTYASILKATGIREQARAPFTPIIKLVFGKDFDKTRITEYAAALSYARRNGQTSETLEGFLTNQPGGIKGCVQSERISKRQDKGMAGDVVLETAKEKLRAEKPMASVKLKLAGEEEFVLLIGRRGTSKGVIEIIKPLDENSSFVDPIIKRATKVS
jgi:hypothetical protein